MRAHLNGPTGASGRLTQAVALGLMALLAATGCSDDDAGKGDGGAGGGGWHGWDGGFSDGSADTAGSSSGGSSGGSSSSGGPIEKEEDLQLGAPEASKNYVFIPAKGRDHVVKVSGKSLGVTLIEVGDRPTVLAAVPGNDAALVINSGSDDVSLIRAAEDKDEVVSLPMLAHCNALDISADGSRAVAWYDHTRAKSGDPTGSFQAVTVLDLGTKPASFDVSTGFRPRSVQFTADGKRAFVVTDDGISVLDFATLKAGDIVAPVSLTTDPLDKGKGREVQITPDGKWAVVRQAGLLGVRAVHLASKKIASVNLGYAPTDIDVLPDSGGAIAVMRTGGKVARIDLPAAATATLPAATADLGPLAAGLARLTADGKTALLYTSVTGNERVGALDIATMKLAVYTVRKSVKAVHIPAGSRRALVVHKAGDGPNHDDPTEAFVDDAWGYSYVDLDTGFTKLELTNVAPSGYAVVDTPARVYMLLADPKNVAHKAHRADLQTFISKDIPLGSRPTFARYLAAAKSVAVSQAHPSGRMTFVDVEKDTAKTITGYELNARVK